MFIVCLLVSLVARNELTVDDLGLLIVMGAVVILIMMTFLIRAAVGSFVQGLPVL